MSALERRLRQRSALAEFALRAMGADDSTSVAEAAADAVCAGLGVEHAAVFTRRSYGLDLLAAAGWPGTDGVGADPPPEALRALTDGGPLAFASPGGGDATRAELAHGLAALVETAPPRLLVAASPEPRADDDEDRAFFRDVAAVLRSAFARAETERALRESEGRARSSEARAHAVLDTTVDGIITIDERGAIQSFNPAAERIFGYRAAEVVGQNVSALMPEPYRGHHDGYLRAYLETGRRRIIGIGREVVGRRRDGSTFPMDLAVSEVVVPGVRLFTGIVRDISQRRTLEREVVRGIEEERRRLGHELHDELGQELSGIRLLTRDLARRLDAEASPLAGDVQELAALIRGADHKARSIARGLVLVNVDAEGLGAALDHLAAHAARLFGVPVAFESDGEPSAITGAAATHVYRIAQEAVTNAARHGRPSRIAVRLEWTPSGLRLSVVDDGVGIPGLRPGPTLAPPLRGADAELPAPELSDGQAPGAELPPAGSPTQRRGLGLQTMLYRARLMGGHLDLSPGDGGGTAVTLAIPLGYTPPDALDLPSDAAPDAAPDAP